MEIHEMSKMFRLVRIYFAIFLVFSLLCLFLFHTPLFSSVRVIFYRGVLLLLVSFLCFVSGYLVLRKKIDIKEETFFAALIMSLSLHLAFFVVFPVSFERSLTVFFLQQLSAGSLAPQEVEEILIKDYIIGKSAVSKRIGEQEVIGFVDDSDKCIQITNKGRMFLDFAKIVNKVYGIE